MRVAASLLLPLAAVAGQDVGVDELEPEEFGTFARGERDAPTVFVKLSEGGRIQMKTGDEWTDTTLAELADVLGRCVELGKKGIPPIASVEADPTTPWAHLQWAMCVIAEQKCRKLELRLGTRTLLYTPPPPWPKRPAEPPTEIKVSIHIIGRDEKVSKWGDKDVTRPTRFRYKFGDCESADVADVREHMAKGVKAAKGSPRAHVFGEIKAGRKVPYDRIFEMMEAFLDAGIPDVHLYGTCIPPEAVRAAAHLPYPAKNYEAD